MGDAQEMLSGLLAAARLSVPDDVAQLLAGKGRALGADGVTIYLVDHEQRLLVPLPQTAAERDPVAIDTTLAGRCLRELELQQSAAGGCLTVWAPVLDGLERLGVVAFDFNNVADAPAAEDELHAFAALVAELVLTKSAYGDLFHIVRRRQPMSLAAEITTRSVPKVNGGRRRHAISAASDIGCRRRTM
jgi:hypothetical protein